MCKKLESWDDLNVQEIGIVSIWKKKKERFYGEFMKNGQFMLINNKIHKNTERYKKKLQKNAKNIRNIHQNPRLPIQKSQNSHDS